MSTLCPIGPEISAVVDDPDIVTHATYAVAIEDPAAAIDKNAPLDNTPFVQYVKWIITEMHEDGTLRELSEKRSGMGSM